MNRPSRKFNHWAQQARQRFMQAEPLRLMLLLGVLVTLGAVSDSLQAQQKSPQTPAQPTADRSAKPGSAAPAPTPAAVMQIKKQVAGDFTYRFTPKGNSTSGSPAVTAPIPLPASAGADNVIALTLPGGVTAKDWQLEILDNGRGNLARLPIMTSGVTPLTESSFTFAQRINVPVQAKGLGVIGAQVTMTSAGKKYSQTTTLQPSDNGIARFDNVPLDEPVTATVTYGTHSQEIQTKTLLQTRTGEGWTPINVDWTDIKTAAPSAPTVTTPPTTSHNESNESSGSTGRRRETSDSRDAETQPLSANTNPLGSVINTVVSLLFLAAIGYGLYWLYQTGRLKNLIAKLGIPSDAMATAGANAPSPFDKPPRAPIQPITEGTADPLMGGGGAGFTSAPVQMGPRLVATMGTYVGSIFPLSGPTADIGRDTGNVVPLPNDTNASRRHAIIQVGNGQYSVMDNGSSNGTFVNGIRISGQSPQTLNPGDEVQIGMTRFRFEA